MGKIKRVSWLKRFIRWVEIEDMKCNYKLLPGLIAFLSMLLLALLVIYFWLFG